MTSRHMRNGHRPGRFEGNGRKPALPATPQAPPASTTEAVPVVGAREDTERIRDEWVRVCEEVKERLRDGRHLQDPRIYQEWELALAIDTIHSAFRFGIGSCTNDLSPETFMDMVWDYREFVREIQKRVCAARLPSEEFMRRAFVPLLNHEKNAGSTALKLLLGEEFLYRQDVGKIIQDLKDHKNKTKPVKQEPEDPLELLAGIGRSSTER